MHLLLPLLPCLSFSGSETLLGFVFLALDRKYRRKTAILFFGFDPSDDSPSSVRRRNWEKKFESFFVSDQSSSLDATNMFVRLHITEENIRLSWVCFDDPHFLLALCCPWRTPASHSRLAFWAITWQRVEGNIVQSRHRNFRISTSYNRLVGFVEKSANITIS